MERGAKGVLPKSISATAERGSVSRSTFNSPKTHGNFLRPFGLRAAAGRRPAFRSIWAIRPQSCTRQGGAQPGTRKLNWRLEAAVTGTLEACRHIVVTGLLACQ